MGVTTKLYMWENPRGVGEAVLEFVFALAESPEEARKKLLMREPNMSWISGEPWVYDSIGSIMYRDWLKQL